jgi:hypothetical protein
VANKGAFKKGEKRPNQGRPKGRVNKITQTVKESFEAAFRSAQELPGVKLEDWAQANPTEFYKIAARLIPSEIKGQVDHTVRAPQLEVVAAALGVSTDVLLQSKDAVGKLRAK